MPDKDNSILVESNYFKTRLGVERVNIFIDRTSGFFWNDLSNDELSTLHDIRKAVKSATKEADSV